MNSYSLTFAGRESAGTALPSSRSVAPPQRPSVKSTVHAMTSDGLKQSFSLPVTHAAAAIGANRAAHEACARSSRATLEGHPLTVTIRCIYTHLHDHPGACRLRGS